MQGAGCRVQGAGCRGQGVGYRLQGPTCSSPVEGELSLWQRGIQGNCSLRGVTKLVSV